MKSVKPRLVGSSTVLTVPKGIQAKYPDYDVYSGRNGAIVFLPKRKNPFTDSEFIKTHQNALSDKDFTQTEVLNDEF
ncbi:antitoxin of toxin-antitoxin stability system [Levilactobacillus parabrevis]|uniref:antitoxin of toxin-antitoxin stability system n=1 Tax=Levilactobacillus parabrevis TaxID=357278 RepID=UPI0021A7E5E6|nr:antitoxin of toxin-antitoxin stability system [Levilactobacillus parabrevis]MCT4486493.1 antitoxin of toxin-antitoxin stability system [Levilactobacillus parabrevis]MCT4489882.1 antitoxin of toxin-antitoxin stability system [Levilactobacillus parabrevis]